MPIVRRWCVFDDCEIVIWHLTETLQVLQQHLTATPEEWLEYEQITHPQKKREWLAGRQAVQELVCSKGLKYSGLVKDEFGKPHLREANAQLSMTHTAQYVGVVLHPTQAVGIDLERVADKLLRVAPKFLSAQEWTQAAGQLARIATYWCAKEALYKLHGTRKLRFREDIPIDPFNDDDAYLTGHIVQLNRHRQYRMHRFWVEDFCGVVAVTTSC
jgi:4'-phosphopantetheinyl transferase